MNRMMAAACMAVAVSAVAGAHEKKMTTTYSGCLERSETGSYQLTHVVPAETAEGKMGKSMKMADPMTKSDSSMKEESMKKGTSMKDDMSMKHDKAMSGKDHEMGAEHMAPGTLAVTASGLDLSQHVGHKVTVTGSDADSMNGMSTFKVTSLKMIASSCS